MVEAFLAILVDNIDLVSAKQQLFMLGIQDSCAYLDLHSIFSQRSAILHQ
jgi:hypothetical protein